jgi:GNAT superfamily N-acetyltransferase
MRRRDARLHRLASFFRKPMPNIAIRFAVAEDAGLLLQLIRELAAYERLAEQVVAREEDLRRYGFGPERRFEALIAALDGEPVGFALFLPDFSTFSGRPGLFLEDLYVREKARGRGVGRRLVARLAAIALARGCPALRFNVLRWNPARGFYRRLGFAAQEDWQPWGATGEVVRRLAREDWEDG